MQSQFSQGGAHSSLLLLPFFLPSFLSVSLVPVASHCPHHSRPEHPPVGHPVDLSVSPSADGCPQCAAAQSLRDGAGPAGPTADEEAEEGAVEETDGRVSQPGEEREDAGLCGGRCKAIWKGMRIKLWGIVESKYFSRGIMIAILINTISMGIEHHQQVSLSLSFFRKGEELRQEVALLHSDIYRTGGTYNEITDFFYNRDRYI